MEFDRSQVFDAVDIGLILLDKELRVQGWNRWMESHSGVAPTDILGTVITDRYPTVSDAKCARLFKSVLTFGNNVYFSQKLHGYVIPLRNPHPSIDSIPHMQQSCTANPIRDAQGAIIGMLIAVHDVTQNVAFEHALLRLGRIDPLTRLFNRGHLERRFAEELDRCRRYERRLSILIVDIDFFKKINDGRGHLCGDHTLRELARLMMESVRKSDFVGRYGGEEFCCLLPETGLDDAFAAAERMRKLVASSTMEYAGELYGVTISVGISEFSDEVNSIEALIRVADQALYQAKREGRNRCIRGGTVSPPPMNAGVEGPIPC